MKVEWEAETGFLLHEMDLLEMIKSFISSITSWFLKFLNQVENKNLLKLENFLPWFESNVLLRPVTCNIPNLNNTVQLLESSINQLKTYSADCRATFNPASLHYARQLKLCDQIDLLWNDYQVGKQLVASSQCLYPYNSNLPDAEYLRDLMHKVKGKLKIIDDLTLIRRTDAQNVKAKGKSSNDASKKSFELPADIKNELKVISNLVDALEIETLKNSMLLNYFSELKQSVHRPFHQLRVVISELPNIQQSKTQMAAEMDAYRATCDIYNEARSAESLVQCARLRNDKQDIEKTIDPMFNCLRVLLNGQYSEPCWNTINGDGFSEWSGVLLKFVKQPVSESISNVAAGVVQSAESGDRDPFLKALEQLQSSLTSALSNKRSADQWHKYFSPPLLEEVSQLDLELFTAYCQDWFEKMQSINGIVKSEEFILSYKTLMAARVNVQKARTLYDKCVVEYNAALTKRKEATAQVETLKKRLVEITLTELYEDIAFVQPVE